MMRTLSWCLGAALLSCAQPMRRPPTEGPRVDAVLPSGKNLFLFDFAGSRYQKWSLSESCRLVDALRGDGGAPSRWLDLPTPGSSFAAVKAVWGPSGNFYLLDRLGKRLCLYDTSAQFLSSLPLPKEIRERNLERLEVHWTRDGIFSFLDLSEGVAWKFTESRAAGTGDWRLINRLRLPLGLESCVWEPYFATPCCLKKSGAGTGRAACFDSYFSVRPGYPPEEGAVGDTAAWPGELPVSRVQAVPGGTDWQVVISAEPCGPAGTRAEACYLPEKRLLLPCPSPPAEGPAAP